MEWPTMDHFHTKSYSFNFKNVVRNDYYQSVCKIWEQSNQLLLNHHAHSIYTEGGGWQMVDDFYIKPQLFLIIPIQKL